MKPRSVQIWFQNRRAKEKNTKKGGDDDSSSDDDNNQHNDEENEGASFEDVITTSSSDMCPTSVPNFEPSPTNINPPSLLLPSSPFTAPSVNYVPNIQLPREHYYNTPRSHFNFELTDINGRRNSIADISDSIIKRGDIIIPKGKERDISMMKQKAHGEFVAPLPIKPHINSINNNNNNHNNIYSVPPTEIHQPFNNIYNNIQPMNKYVNNNANIVLTNNFTNRGTSTLHNSNNINTPTSNSMHKYNNYNNNNNNGVLNNVNNKSQYNADKNESKNDHQSHNNVNQFPQEKFTPQLPPPPQTISNQSLSSDMKMKLLGSILPHTEEQKQQDNYHRRNSDPLPDHSKSHSLLRSSLQNQFAKTLSSEEGNSPNDIEKSKFPFPRDNEPSYKRRISFLVSDPDTSNSSFWERREKDNLIHIGWSSLHPKRHSQDSITPLPLNTTQTLPSISPISDDANKSRDDAFVNIPKYSDTNNPRKKSFSKSYARLPSINSLFHDLPVNVPAQQNNPVKTINNDDDDSPLKELFGNIKKNVKNKKEKTLSQTESLSHSSNLNSDINIHQPMEKEHNEEELIKLMSKAIEKRKIDNFKQLYEEFLSSRDEEIKEYYWTPLHSAIKMENLEFTQIILEQSKVFLNSQEYHEQFSPLHISSVTGNTQICSYLLQQGAKINLIDKRARTPLYYSCVYGHISVVELLLINGADVEFRDEEGHTALQAAALYGFTKIVVALLQRGANLNVRDNDNHTALYYAIRESHHDTAYSLRAAGAVDDFPSKKKKVE